MRDILKVLGLIGAALLALAVISWFGLMAGRPMAKYAEETRKQTYDTSRQYEQGTNRDIARYCEQMRGAETAAGRRALAALIRSTNATYDGDLSSDNRACVAEAERN